MNISDVKRVPNSPEEQFVSWSDGDRKGTVLIPIDAGYELLSDADKEAFVIKKSGISLSAPIENVVASRSFMRPTEELAN